MNFPAPTEKQAHLLWAALTGLSLAIIVALVVGLVWGLGRVLNVLAPVIWPLAVAGVLAYLLDPVVDFFERRRVPRTRAIALVFLIALFLVLGLFSSIVPRIVVETQQLVRNVPVLVAKLQKRTTDWMNEPSAPLQSLLQRFGISWPQKFDPVPAITNAPADATQTPTTEPAAPNAPTSSSPSLFDQVDSQTIQKASEWVGTGLKALGGWLAHQASRLTGLFGIIAGLALIPIYLFYFLLEKRAITDNWTTYLPLRDSGLKEELVFVLRSINDYLIAFFRGQVLVAICDGILYGIGFALIGLPYAFLIGAVAMVLTIIPFLGAIVTCGAALLIALVTFGDWQHPLLVLGVFAVVQGIEGYVLQPKILGDRVGLHPMVIIVAIMAGTTLLGGILGGLLAIPLAAALRVMMFRYVWKKRAAET
jgi:predicted PurR-regulated permease PerM